MSKGFHEKLLKFATDMGMGGLGYLEVAEDMTYKGIGLTNSFLKN